jgi:hypothetical protein
MFAEREAFLSSISHVIEAVDKSFETVKLSRWWHIIVYESSMLIAFLMGDSSLETGLSSICSISLS